MTRERLRQDDGPYFGAAPAVSFIPSGATMLNCVLGGGWAQGRISNIVGDKSTGKTLVAIEQMANFRLQHPKSPIYYAEAEAAFDKLYAHNLGLPEDGIEFPGEGDDPVDTVEGFFEHLGSVLDKGDQALYILDSLDALSDREEKKREIGEGTYGTGKAKKMSELFRRMAKRIERSQVTLTIISQLRDNIGVTFGAKEGRSGGRAMDFYASQVIWLAHLGPISQTRSGVERVVGIDVRARCKKNKVALPFRECEFPIFFNYGIDDLRSCLEWLIEVELVEAAGFDNAKGAKSMLRSISKMGQETYDDHHARVSAAALKTWNDIEAKFRPKRRKYGERSEK